MRRRTGLILIGFMISAMAGLVVFNVLVPVPTLEVKASPMAVLASVVGQVETRHQGDPGWKSASLGQVLAEGDRLISNMTGRELTDYRRDHIGFIFQAYNLFPVLTVEENIEYIMLLQGTGRKERHRRVMSILEQVELSDKADRLPSKLSGGQQQRVAVARAMVSRPSLVIADEPTANLDSKTSGDLLDMMRKLNEETGMTFLFSTHDEIVMERARKVVVIRDGKLDGVTEKE